MIGPKETYLKDGKPVAARDLPISQRKDDPPKKKRGRPKIKLVENPSSQSGKGENNGEKSRQT